MSLGTGHLVSQAKPTNNQGSIHTNNSELFKLLHNSSENQTRENTTAKNFSAETKREETVEQILDNNRKFQNTDNFKSITNLVDNQNKNVKNYDNLIEKHSFVSGAGDAKVSSFGLEEKENYSLLSRSVELQQIDENFKDESRRNNFSDISSGRHVAFVKTDSRTFGDADHNGNVQKQVKPQNTSGNQNREVACNKLSDIAESDCETLRTSSCELAELRSPSRNSLNADFQGSSLPSSPAQPVTPKRGKSKDDNVVVSARDSPLDSNTRTAGSTPFYSSPKQQKTISSVALKGELQHSPDRKFDHSTLSASRKFHRVSYEVTASSLLGLSKTAFQEAGHKLDNKNKSEANTPIKLQPTDNVISHAELSVTSFPISTTTTSRRVHGSRNSEPNPGYSELSPRLYSRSSEPKPAYSELSPRLYSRSSYFVNNISSNLLQKHVIDTDLGLENSLHSRNKVPYESQRLKLQGDAAKRAGSVLTSRDHVDSDSVVREKANFITESFDIEQDSLDIEKDSLEISLSDNKKDNTVSTVDWMCQNQNETTEHNVQGNESVLQNNLIKEHSNSNKLDNIRCDGSKISNKTTNQGRVIVAAGENSSFPHVDLLKKVNITENEKQKTVNEITDFEINSIDDEALRVFYGKIHEQQLTAHLMKSETSTASKTENLEFVLKTDANKEGTPMYYSAQGSSHNTVGQKADPPEVTGSVTRNLSRETSGVRKVYVEPPTFTREEEDIYRFVDSRLDDTKEDIVDTYRELDMIAIQNQEKYDALGMEGQKHIRYMDVEGRYEDRESQVLGSDDSKQFFPGDTHSHPQDRGLQVAQSGQNTILGEYNSGRKNGFDSYEQHSKNGRDLQQQAHSNPPSQINPHQGLLNQQGMVSPHQGLLNQQGMINPQQGLHNQGLINPQQGLHNQQSQVNQFRFSNNQPEPEVFQPHHFIQRHQPTIENQLQAHINQQQPHFNKQQPQGNQQQPEQSNKPPVRGLTLPTGPTYDPLDEEDLKRETNYQQGLRVRIEDGNRRTQQVEVPKPPENTNPSQQQFASPDFAQDSLEYDTNNGRARHFGAGFVHDSVIVYTSSQPLQPQQTMSHFRNPASPPPQHFASYGRRGSLQDSSRLDNVHFDSEDFTDHVDIRQQRVNPQIRPRFYNPQVDQHQGSQTSEEYIDGEPNTDRADADVMYDVAQRYEDRQEEFEEPIEAVKANLPKYDYVTNNKGDLGKQHPKSYTRIHEITREEKDKLQEIFIQPQPKSKIPSLRKREQGQQRPQFTDYQPQNNSGMTPAEKVWAERSATLAKKFDGASNNKGRRRGPGSLQKFHSDSSLSQTTFPHRRRQNFLAPSQQQRQSQLQAQDTKTFITEMPTPLKEGEFQNHPVPLSNLGPIHQTELMVQPVTQQIVTQDGQRISVDVNLKLISPASAMDGSHQYYYTQQPQQYPPNQQPQQYPPNRHSQQYPPSHHQQQYPSNHHSQQYPHTQQPYQYPPTQYPSDGQGRQYPATVTSYGVGVETEREGVPALEYYSQEYDSDNNEYRHGSPRERYSADEALRILNDSRTQLNPYGKIPPISGVQGMEHPSSAPVPDQAGSYMDMYMKQKVKDNERPWYKVYGLNDYRRMQKEVRLGTLGPELDSDAARERREKMMRQNDYAKVIMDKNRSLLANRKPPAFPRPKEDNDILSRRKLAIEYAKSVPKPTTKVQPNEFNNYELASEKSPIAKHHRQEPQVEGQKNSPSHKVWKKEKEMDILDIEKLRQRYEEDKQNEAVIRRNAHYSNRENYY